MNFKNVIVLVAVLLMSASTFAQKGSVTKADGYLAKKDYASAKAEIDVAITIEKAVAKSKTWFVRGKIYQAIALNEDVAVNALDPNALQLATDAYNKVLTMEKESSPTNLLTTNNLSGMWGNYLNKGGVQYGEEKFAEALVSFENALVVKPNDSTTLLYAGVSAQQAKDTDKTLKYYYQMVESDVASMDIYSTLIFMERTETKDDQKALAVVRAAKEKFPNEAKFSQEEISLLLIMDKIDEAKQKLETAISEDPSNIKNHLNLGLLYDNLGSVKKEEGNAEESKASYNLAKDSYQKALDIDSESYVANFNIGVIYVNIAKEYYDQVNDMDLKAYNKYGESKTKEANDILMKGLPYMEKATSINKEDVSGLKALQQMYTQLKMYDKAEAVMDRVDALEGGE